MKAGSPEHVAIWDAINELVIAGGGRNVVSPARMKAVPAVEKALRRIYLQALEDAARACRDKASNPMSPDSDFDEGYREGVSECVAAIGAMKLLEKLKAE